MIEEIQFFKDADGVDWAQVKAYSTWSGKTRVRELPITCEQFFAWQQGKLIQQAMPHLSADDREWLISGCTPEEYEEIENLGEEE